MQLTNLTPFPAVAFRQMSSRDAFEATVAVRGGFRLRRGGAMRPSPRQPDFQWADQYEGDPHTSCLVRSTDLAPYKPGTDVTLLGDSFAPDGKPAQSWVTGLRIGDRFERKLRVTGPRQWQPFKPASIWSARQVGRTSGANWRASEPRPVRRMKLCWTNAAGGGTLGLADDASAAIHPDNPLGTGMLDARQSASDRSYPAPCMEPVAQTLTDNMADLRPVGFGFISPWWRPRLRHAGTYDEHWKRERHPLLPEDFDDHFWQSADPDMVIEPWLDGNEAFTLTHLFESYPSYDGHLPGVRLIVRVHRPDGPLEDRELALDGVHLDLRDGGEDCFLTWRSCFPLQGAILARLVLYMVDMDYRRVPRDWVARTFSA